MKKITPLVRYRSKVYFFCAQISVFSVGSNVRNNTPRASRSIERPSNLYSIYKVWLSLNVSWWKVEPVGFVAVGVNYLCVSMQNSTCIAEFAVSRIMHRIQSETLYVKHFLCAIVSYICYNFFHTVLNLSTLGTNVPFFHINENAQIYF